MEKKMNEKYNPSDFEDELYKNWNDKGYFTPVIDKTKTP